MQLPLSAVQADVLHALCTEGRAIFYRKREDTYTLRGRHVGALNPVAAGDVDAMIELGYIGRRDQRAVWFITERGKIALEEYARGAQ